VREQKIEQRIGPSRAIPKGLAPRRGFALSSPVRETSEKHEHSAPLEFNHASFAGLVGSRRNLLLNLCLALSALTISVLLTGKQIFLADWGIIDDHQIFQLLGNGNSVHVWEIPRILIEQTEVGQPFSAPRFRPSFQLLRLIEISAWGDNVHLWYAFRTILFAFFITAFWRIAARFLGVWIGIALIMPAFTAPFWGDVWGRLAPSEIYASLGIALWALSLYGIFSRPPSNRSSAIALLMLGTVITIGSKETMLAFAGFTLVILGILIVSRENVTTSCFCALPVLLLGSLIGLSMLAKNVGSGDPYGRAVDFERVSQAMVAVREAMTLFWLPTVLGAMTIIGLFVYFSGDRSRKAIAKIAKPTITLLVISACIGIFYVSQYVFYDGFWPTTYMRYDFPGALCFRALVGVFLAYCAVTLGKLNWRSSVRNFTVWATVSILFISGIPWQFPILERIDRNIVSTRAFSQTIRLASEAARAEPSFPIILDAHGPWTYEPIDSVARYLRHYGATNDIALRYHEGRPAAEGVFKAPSEDELKGWETQGRPVTGLPPKPMLVPLSHVSSRGSNCISIGINGPPNYECSKVFSVQAP
jgi:hypothetical protein